MKNQIYTYENRLVHQEKHKERTPGRDPDDIKREYSEQARESYRESREARDEVREEFAQDQMTNLFRSAKMSADTLAKQLISPDGKQNEELEKWQEESDENNLQIMLEEFEQSEDIDSAKQYFDKEFDIPGLGEVVKKTATRERLSENDYPIIAQLSSGAGHLAKLAAEKFLKDPTAETLTYTADEVEEKSESLMKNALFQMLLMHITDIEKQKVIDIMIENQINEIPKDRFALVIADLHKSGLINEQKFAEICEKYKDVMPNLEQFKNIDPKDLYARLQEQIERDRKEHPDRLPNINLTIKAPAYSAKDVDQNYFAKHASLKNIFLVEYLGRLMTVGAGINILSNFMGGLLAKENRGYFWKRMFTDPNLLLQVGTVAAIYEHITSEGHGKIVGEGVFSEWLGFTEGAEIAKELAEFVKNPENKYPELDSLFLKKLSDNKENYSAIYRAFSMSKTSEEIELMRRSLMTPSAILREFNPSKSEEDVENLKTQLKNAENEEEKIEILKTFNPEKTDEACQKLTKDLENSDKNITQIVGLEQSFLAEIDTTLQFDPDKQLHIFDLCENLMKETKHTPYELFRERIYPHFKDEFPVTKATPHYLTEAKDEQGQGEVMPKIRGDKEKS